MSTPRRDIEELLPFLANGTLEGAERAEVEASVAVDPALAQELEALKRVRQQMQSEAFETSPGELGLARLMRDVEREGQTLAPAAETSAPGSGVSVVQLRFWQVAAALVAAIAIGQFAFSTGPAELSGDVMTLADGGGGPAMAPVAFRAAFDATASEGALRDALLQAGLQIVAGPSAIGLYDLAPVSEEVDLETAAATLEAAGFLEILERVDSP